MLHYVELDSGMLSMVNPVEPSETIQEANSLERVASEDGETAPSPAPSSDGGSPSAPSSDGDSSPAASANSVEGGHPFWGWGHGVSVDHTGHATTGGSGSCLDNPRHNSDYFTTCFSQGGEIGPVVVAILIWIEIFLIITIGIVVGVVKMFSSSSSSFLQQPALWM